MKTHSIPWLLLVLLTLAACKKEEVDALPKATQEGKNTFGCLVDGKAFLPKPASALSITRRQPLEASVYRSMLLVSGMGEGYVEFALLDAFQPGTYTLGETRTNRYGYYSARSISYFTNATYTGTVTLTRIDTVAKIAAGTFEFTAYDYQDGQTVRVTDGRFDVRLERR